MIIIGISGGIAVGTGFAAFLTFVDIVPRLAQITGSEKSILLYQKILIISIVLVTMATFFKWSIGIHRYILLPIGFMMGTYIGLLAAALTEVINVIPVFVRRLKVEKYINYILYSLAFGKVIGSLIQWIAFVKVS